MASPERKNEEENKIHVLSSELAESFQGKASEVPENEQKKDNLKVKPQDFDGKNFYVPDKKTGKRKVATDRENRTFDHNIHAWDFERGEPVLTNRNTLKLKKEHNGPQPDLTERDEPVPEISHKKISAFVVHVFEQICVKIGGQEAKFNENITAEKTQRQYLEDAVEEYFDNRDISIPINPEVALFLAVSMVLLPKLEKPTVKQRVQSFFFRAGQKLSSLKKHKIPTGTKKPGGFSFAWGKK